MERLPRAFYDRDTVEVAKDLLGKVVCARPARTLRLARIVETEAYHGLSDQASHGRRLTPRSAIMYGPPGHAYIYVIYGIWHCLNVVTGPERFPSAVLLRAGAISGAREPRLAAGPGKLCRALRLDRRLNGADLVDGHKLWLADDGFTPDQVRRGPRIGVDYAGAWARKPWRFWIAGHPSVSR